VFFVLVAMNEAVYTHVCLVGEQVGLEVGLQRRRQGQLLDAVDRRVGRNGPAAELLQRQHCKMRGKVREMDRYNRGGGDMNI